MFLMQVFLMVFFLLLVLLLLFSCTNEKTNEVIDLPTYSSNPVSDTGLSFNEDGILVLNDGAGGIPPLWGERYYDVSNGRVSRFYFNPVKTYNELVVHYSEKKESGESILIIQNMFDPSIYYKEIERDFALANWSIPDTAEFIDAGKKLRITYWLKSDDEEVTEIIDDNPCHIDLFSFISYG